MLNRSPNGGSQEDPSKASAGQAAPASEFVSIYGSITGRLISRPPGYLGVLTYEDPYGQAGRIDPEGNLDVAARLTWPVAKRGRQRRRYSSNTYMA
jgi:hypothetical protein